MRRVALIAGVAAALGCTERVPLPGALSMTEDAGTETGPDGRRRDSRGEPNLGASRSDGDAGRSDGDAGRSDVDADGSDACEWQYSSLPVKRDFPKLIIALDLSMANADATSGSLLEVAETSLRDLLPSYDAAIQFGYEPFPARSCASGTCCASLDLRVEPKGRTANAVQRELACDVSGACRLDSDQSPSFSALLAARQYYEAEGENVSRFVLLLTDHDPLCEGQQSGCEQAVAESSRLAALGVETIVVGLGAGADATDCMSRIAIQGAWSAAKRPSFAGDATTLKSLLKAVFDKVAECQCALALESRPATSQVVLTFDEQFVPRDSKRVDGWDFVGSNTRLGVFGAYCSQLTGGHVTSVEAGFICTTCAGPNACK